MSEARPYPRYTNTDAGEIEFRLMSRADEGAVLEFARKLPTHDLLFLPRNISEPIGQTVARIANTANGTSHGRSRNGTGAPFTTRI